MGLTETTKRWIGKHNSVDGEGVDWVLELGRVIKKINLTLTAKFIRLLVIHYLSPIVADNIVTWDREVMVTICLLV